MGLHDDEPVISKSDFDGGSSWSWRNIDYSSDDNMSAFSKIVFSKWKMHSPSADDSDENSTTSSDDSGGEENINTNAIPMDYNSYTYTAIYLMEKYANTPPCSLVDQKAVRRYVYVLSSLDKYLVYPEDFLKDGSVEMARLIVGGTIFENILDCMTARLVRRAQLIMDRAKARAAERDARYFRKYIDEASLVPPYQLSYTI